MEDLGHLVLSLFMSLCLALFPATGLGVHMPPRDALNNVIGVMKNYRDWGHCLSLPLAPLFLPCAPQPAPAPPDTPTPNQ